MASRVVLLSLLILVIFHLLILYFLWNFYFYFKTYSELQVFHLIHLCQVTLSFRSFCNAPKFSNFPFTEDFWNLLSWLSLLLSVSLITSPLIKGAVSVFLLLLYMSCVATGQSFILKALCVILKFCSLGTLMGKLVKTILLTWDTHSIEKKSLCGEKNEKN